MRYLASCLVVVLAAETGAVDAMAERFQWSEAAGGNGHWYEPVLTPSGITWDAAKLLASARGGYLASVTSAAENQFAFGLVSQPDFWSLGAGSYSYGPWLGGYQSPGSPEPAGGWGWVSGEAFGYTNWAPGEPNDLGGEGYVHLFNKVSSSQPQAAPTWNDSSSESPRAPIRGYVVEYDPAPPPPQLHALSVGINGRGGHNGGADALAIWAQIRRFPNYADTNPAPLALDRNISNFTLIKEQVGRIKDSVRPGDAFIFYLGAHGYVQRSGGDETAVLISVDSLIPPNASFLNTSDEYIELSASESDDLSDDLLMSWFDDPEWDQVYKIFLIDACHSGGFTGDGNEINGDLEKLPRARLFASCAEAGVAFYSPYHGNRGVWSLALEQCLSSANTIDELRDGLEDWDWSAFAGASLPLLNGDTFPPDDASAAFEWQPTFSGSDDFNLVALPEPATLSILALGGLALLRRRHGGSS